MRELMRSVAKARLKAMQVPHVNRVMGMNLKQSKNRKLQSTAIGRKILEKLRADHIPVWRRVVYGSLAQEGYNAQMGIGKRRKYRAVR